MSRQSLMTISAFISVLLLAFFVVGDSSAQETPANQQNSPACAQVAWSCLEVTDLDPNRVGRPHRQRLRAQNLPPKDIEGNPQQFYVACGIDTKDGFLLTTGNAQNDDKLCLGRTTYKKLQDEYNYFLDLMDTPNPMTAPDGSVDITVMPANAGRPLHHTCFLGWMLPVTTTGGSEQDPDQNESSGGVSSLVYSTFTFPAAKASCTSVYADPYGRTYNSSLKPVPGAKVSIYDYDTNELMKVPGLPNPVTTDESGIFNFNLPPGRTFLRSTLQNITDVHPNYSLAYTEPYVYGDLIVETLGNAEQRDIAVAGGEQPVLKVMGYTNVRTGDHILIQGSVSWPLTIVDIMQGARSISRQQANKFGQYAFRVDPAQIDPTQQITLKLTEVDLTQSATEPAENAETSEITMDPIPSYLEGYAYDENGRIVPFATVRIRLRISDGIYYSTKADQTGFYTVAPKYLPILPFYIEVIAPGTIPGSTGGIQPGGTEPDGSQPGDGGLPGTQVTQPAGSVTGMPGITTAPGTTDPGTAVGGASVISVPVYAQQNKEYHAANAVDIMAGTKNGVKVDPNAVADSNTAIYGDQNNGDDFSSNTLTPEEQPIPDQQRYVTLLVLVLLLLFVGTGAVVLLRKKGRHDLFGDDDGHDGDQTYTRSSADDSIDTSSDDSKDAS